MLMHAALPGTQHLNDSKSVSAPLLGTGHSTVLHQLPPPSLDTEHCRNGTKQGWRIPRSCCIWGFGKSQGNSRCGLRQNPLRRSQPHIPRALPCQGSTARAAFLLQELLCSCSRSCSAPAWQGTAQGASCSGSGLPNPCRTRSPILLGLVAQWKEAKKTFP